MPTFSQRGYCKDCIIQGRTGECPAFGWDDNGNPRDYAGEVLSCSDRKLLHNVKKCNCEKCNEKNSNSLTNKLLKEIDDVSTQYSSCFQTTELITTYESIIEEIKCHITRIIEREN